ncbi:hypothetical protein [Motiliproteus sp. SC1-56]|uniref:hypothetical protein n=1 Tax=Motiliproteus sp. SC1-56 TaxID=2799565 RepID=UPI001A8EC48A|nr:hypothetical protein [Motiliproteus sp. SC1-56]
MHSAIIQSAPLRPTANQLLHLQGITPADNPFNFSTTLHWKSDFSSIWLRSLHQWDQLLDKCRQMPWAKGPAEHLLTLARATLSQPTLEAIRRHAEVAAANGDNPDLFRVQNDRIEARYADRLKALCGLCLHNGKFDAKQVGNLFETPRGIGELYRILLELTLLEYSYHSQGLTRLSALKELLKTLLMAITETPVAGRHPYRRYDAQGQPVTPFAEYLEQAKQRLECLFAADAFDLLRVSERSPAADIGLCQYEVVPGSELHGASLRRYLPLPGVTQQETLVYLSSPLINQAEIFDLAEGKSVIHGLLQRGYQVYLVVYGNAGPGESELGLDFYGKEVHDRNLELIRRDHPETTLHVMGYCMGGTLILPYLARRAEERRALGLEMDIRKVALMATPVRFDDDKSGHAPMRDVIRTWYDGELMKAMFGRSNVPPQVIEVGMNLIQPGVRYTVTRGFFERATSRKAIEDAAPFLNWLLHGTRFPAKAHRQWIADIFMGNRIWKGTYCLPSTIPELDGQPVDMGALRKAGVCLMDYRGERDPISPMGSCVASETWGCHEANEEFTTHGLNRTIEKNVGHIFVVSEKHLGDYMERVTEFYQDGTPAPAAG